MSRLLVWVFAALLLSSGCGESEEEPATLPEGALPLSELALRLERDGYDPILEIEFEDGAWEVEAYKDGQVVEVEVDPLSGVVKPED